MQNGSCSSDYSSIATVTVNQNPVAVISSNSPACATSTLKLYAQPNSMASYTWTCPDAVLSIQNPVRSNASTAMGGTYKLKVVDGNNCADSTTSLITVNPLPSPAITGVSSYFNSQQSAVPLHGKPGQAFSQGQV